MGFSDEKAGNGGCHSRFRSKKLEHSGTLPDGEDVGGWVSDDSSEWDVKD